MDLKCKILKPNHKNKKNKKGIKTKTAKKKICKKKSTRKIKALSATKKRKKNNPGYRIIKGNIYYPRLNIRVPLITFFKEISKQDIDQLMNKYYKKHNGR